MNYIGTEFDPEPMSDERMDKIRKSTFIADLPVAEIHWLIDEVRRLRARTEALDEAISFIAVCSDARRAREYANAARDASTAAGLRSAVFGILSRFAGKPNVSAKPDPIITTAPCPECKGRGVIVVSERAGYTCAACKGTGRFTEGKTTPRELTAYVIADMIVAAMEQTGEARSAVRWAHSAAIGAARKAGVIE